MVCLESSTNNFIYFSHSLEKIDEELDHETERPEKFVLPWKMADFVVMIR